MEKTTCGEKPENLGQERLELHAKVNELMELTENIPGGVHRCRNDDGLTLVTVSKSFLELFGYTREEIRELYQDHFKEMIYYKDRDAALQEIQEQLSRGDIVKVEYRIRRKNGTRLWIMDQGKLVRMPDGSSNFFCMLVDITEQRREQETMRLSLERHKIIMNQSTDIIFEWDIRKDTLTFSPNWDKKFGYSPIRGQIRACLPLSENIHPDDMFSLLKIMEDTSAGRPYSEAELRIRDIWGNYTWCKIRATTQYDGNGAPIKAVGVILDIDANKRQRQWLQECAQRDPLTGLLNKETTGRRAQAMLDLQGGALFLIDIDDFKQVNDRHGHLCGDAVLSDVAAALKGLFRATDVLGRIGGDEFLAFLPGVGDSGAREKAGAIQRALGEIRMDGGGGISCSVGIALAPGDARDFHGLYHCADVALYHMKYTGKGKCGVYDASLHGDAVHSGTERSAVGTVIDSDTGAVHEGLGQYSFRMLYSAADIPAAVTQLLEIVGRAYDAGRVYILERSGDGLSYNMTFEWCGKGIPAKMNRMQNQYWKDLPSEYFTRFRGEGVFYCGDAAALSPALRRLPEMEGVRAFLQCAIMEEGVFRGLVGYDACGGGHRWTEAQADSMALIANVIASFLLQHRLKKRLASAEQPHPAP